VAVRLGTTGSQLELTISDDGVGFDPLSARAGMGLTNMSARAQEMGGAFRLTSGPGEGTLVRLSIPFGTSAARHELKAVLWAAVLCACIWYLASRGASDQPLVLGLAGVAGIALARYSSAYIRVRKAGAPA
jgi:hypothetical protein